MVVLLVYFGLSATTARSSGNLVTAYALAFSAGTLLCIASSDLLPELQFHHHDRGMLSATLLAGLGVAIAAAQLEEATHAPHSHTELRALGGDAEARRRNGFQDSRFPKGRQTYALSKSLDSTWYRR